MQITRKSRLSGVTRTKNINVTQEQIDAWKNGMYIQNAMPFLSVDDLEFIKTGITSEEWNEAFPDE